MHVEEGEKEDRDRHYPRSDIENEGIVLRRLEAPDNPPCDLLQAVERYDDREDLQGRLEPSVVKDAYRQATGQQIDDDSEGDSKQKTEKKTEIDDTPYDVLLVFLEMVGNESGQGSEEPEYRQCGRDRHDTHGEVEETVVFRPQIPSQDDLIDHTEKSARNQPAEDYGRALGDGCE